MKLGVVDQSPIPAGGTGADALRNTIDLAQHCDRFGYGRYWLAEHHNTEALAGSAPEILIGAVANATERIRVGSGGVMLSHYSSLKVAETFKVLESLHPGRVDLGIGRAPGSDALTASALAPTGQRLPLEYYPNQVDELVGLLGGTLGDDSPIAGVQATPLVSSVPEMWMLASSAEGAGLAAHFGLPLGWAHFITVEEGEAVVDAYREYFQPSSMCAEPTVNLAVSVMCAETDEKAERVASSLREWRRRGLQGPIPSIEESVEAEKHLRRDLSVQTDRKPMIVGSPETVVEQLEKLAAAHGTDELLIVTICHRHEDRIRSYELLAQAALA